MKTLLLLLLLSLPALGQAPKPADKPTTLPLTIEIKDADAKLVTEKHKELRLAQLEARNFSLELEDQIRRAKEELRAKERFAADLQREWQTMISTLSGIPNEKMPDYEMTYNEPDKKWIIRRKSPVTP